MKGGLGNLMQQAQQMQENMQKAQQELGALEVTGKSGGGLVSIIMTGKHDVKRVSIDPSLMGDDKDMLEDLVAAAVNDAVRQLEQETKDKMASVAGGIDLPEGFNFPFK